MTRLSDHNHDRFLDRQCRGKRRYRRQRDAKKALKRISSVPGGAGKKEPYRCALCGMWHLGTPKKKPTPMDRD